MRAILLAAVLLPGCASAPETPRTGSAAAISTPAAAAQCAAEPTLDWCARRARP